jgi:hypothetical protein
MTDYEHMLRLIDNDARNVRGIRRFGGEIEAHLRVIADCAARLFQARPIASELSYRAACNLRLALQDLYGLPHMTNDEALCAAEGCAPIPCQHDAGDTVLSTRVRE